MTAAGMSVLRYDHARRDVLLRIDGRQQDQWVPYVAILAASRQQDTGDGLVPIYTGVLLAIGDLHLDDY